MSRRTKVIGLSLLIFFFGIFLTGLSNVLIEGLVPYKEALAEPIRGREIEATLLFFQLWEAGTCGINITGSFQGYEGAPIFIITDLERDLVLLGPEFNVTTSPPRIIEFDINEPGVYRLEFNIIASDDSCVELYQSKYEMGSIRLYVYLYYVGVLLTISGVVGVIAGLFVLSERE